MLEIKSICEEEVLKSMPWALDPFRNMELSKIIEKPY